MQLCFNLSNNLITLSMDETTQVQLPIPLTGGQHTPVGVQFHTDGTPALPPAGSALLLGLKQYNANGVGEYEGTYLTSVSDWTIPGSGTGPCTATLSTFTDAIKTALNLNGDGGIDDKPYIDTIAELQYWPVGAELPVKSQSFTIRLANWVNQGDEGIPDDADPPFAARLTALETVLAAFGPLPAVTGYLGGGSTNLDGVPTLTTAAGRVVMFIAAADGRPRIFQLEAGTDAEDATLFSIVRPDDYDATTNAKVWVSRL